MRGCQVALPYPETEENVAPNGRRAVSRGVARRNAKLTALRELVSPDLAILAVDLAPGKQAAVACDHESVVLERRMLTGSAWCIEQILAEPVAARAGFAGWCWRASRPGTGGSRWRWPRGRSQSLMVATQPAGTAIAGVSGNMLNGRAELRGYEPSGLLPLPPNG